MKPAAPTTSTFTAVSRRWRRHHALIDGAEYGMAGGIEQFHAHPIPEFHVLGSRLAVIDQFDAAPLGNACRSDAAVIRVGNRARADDRAGTQVAGARGVLDQLLETETHASAVRVTKFLAVPIHVDRQLHPAIA